jgi:hypothetical protein
MPLEPVHRQEGGSVLQTEASPNRPARQPALSERLAASALAFFIEPHHPAG